MVVSWLTTAATPSITGWSSERFEARTSRCRKRVSTSTGSSFTSLISLLLDHFHQLVGADHDGLHVLKLCSAPHVAIFVSNSRNSCQIHISRGYKRLKC